MKLHFRVCLRMYSIQDLYGDDEWFSVFEIGWHNLLVVRGK